MKRSIGRLVALILAAGTFVIAQAQPALACPTTASADAAHFQFGMTCSDDGDASFSVETTADGQTASPHDAFVWVSVCTRFDPTHPQTGSIDCAIARTCAAPVERKWALWGHRPSGSWDLLGEQCFGRPPTAANTPRPQVTPGLVLQAVRRIGLPALRAHTQPEDRTLVNFATIFYTEAQPFTRTITLLGQRVDVRATPSSFTWHHGDGTSETTSTPGAPYPRKDVTYEYTDAHRTVATSVDVTYTATFRVNGGAWRDVPGTVTITGPATDLRISEATAVLSGNYG